jgi:hypothetical protein
MEEGITVREKGVFYKLTAENENAATELLCNLCGFEEYRGVIFDALGLNSLPITFDDIETQMSISESSKSSNFVIPDIIIKNTDVEIYIENKVNKFYKLRRSQLDNYPNKLLQTKKIVRLIYLIPKDYKYYEDIERIIKKYKFPTFVYWEDLLKKLEYFNKNKSSEIIDESIRYFNKILKSIPKTNFTEEDFLFMNNIENFRAEINTMAKEMELFSNVIGKLKENLNLGFGQKEPILECAEDEFGYYFCKNAVFLGYSFALLDSEKAVEKEYALSLAIQKDSMKPMKIKTYDKRPYVFDSDWYYFKIDPGIFPNEEREKLLLDDCQEILSDLLKE